MAHPDDKTGFTIEGSAIEALMIKAILEAWTPEQRNALIAQSIATLFEKTYSTTYGRNRTVIEVALAKGAQDAAERVISDLLQSDEYKYQLVTIVKKELNRQVFEPEPGAPAPIQNAIANGLSKYLRVDPHIA